MFIVLSYVLSTFNYHQKISDITRSTACVDFVCYLSKHHW